MLLGQSLHTRILPAPPHMEHHLQTRTYDFLDSSKRKHTTFFTSAQTQCYTHFVHTLFSKELEHGGLPCQKLWGFREFQKQRKHTLASKLPETVSVVPETGYFLESATWQAGVGLWVVVGVPEQVIFVACTPCSALGVLATQLADVSALAWGAWGWGRNGGEVVVEECVIKVTGTCNRWCCASFTNF